MLGRSWAGLERALCSLENVMCEVSQLSGYASVGRASPNLSAQLEECSCGIQSMATAAAAAVWLHTDTLWQSQ